MMQALSTAESGKRYTIKWMFGNKNVLDFLHQYDFKEGSIIDKEAEKRATSVYLVDRTIPMLPERLCNW